ncbi:MAG: hypothetical protein RLZZ292_3526, partial [Bacteroidota bacterium]
MGGIMIMLLVCNTVVAQNGVEICGSIRRTKAENTKGEPLYYDRFGNEYLESELLLPDPGGPTPTPPCNPNLKYFNLIFEVNISPAQKEVICKVFSDIEELIVPYNTDIKVNIEVQTREVLVLSEIPDPKKPDAIRPPIPLGWANSYWAEKHCGVVPSLVEYLFTYNN